MPLKIKNVREILETLLDNEDGIGKEAAVLGTTIRGTVGLRIAIGMIATTGTTTSAFGLPVLSQYFLMPELAGGNSSRV